MIRNTHVELFYDKIEVKIEEKQSMQIEDH